jgi:ATP-dependent Zn protease
MIRTTRALVVALASVCAVLASLAAVAGGAATIHYTHESYTTFQKQLQTAAIRAVTFNKKAHTVHVTLSDGRHMLASYPSHDEPQLAARLAAKGVPVTIEKKRHKTAPVHHTLRYIAGGILVVAILAILIVLLVGRRRSLMREDGGEAAQAGG